MGARNAVPASGGESLIIYGVQTRFGVPVTTFAAPSGNTPGMIQRRFPGVRNTLDPTGEFTQSESFLGTDDAPPSILTAINPAGQWEFEVLPEDMVHHLRFAMNDAEVDASVDITSKSDADGSNPTNVIRGVGAINSFASTITEAEGTANMWPGRISLTFSGSNTAAAGAKVTFVGSTSTGRAGSRPKIEEKDITSGDLTTGIISDFFYRRVTSIVITGVTGGMIKVDFAPETKTTNLELDSLSSGLLSLTAQMRKGPTLFVAQDVTCGNTQITMGQNVRVLQDVQASRIIQNALVTDVNAAATTGIPDVDEDFRYSNLDVPSPKGTVLFLGDIGSGDLDTVDMSKPVTTDNVVVGINNNLEQATGNTGSLAAGQPTVGDAGRQITLQVEKNYETGDDAYDWQGLFETSGDVPAVVRLYGINSVGRQTLQEYSFASCSLSDVPAIAVEGRGTINQTLNFEATSLAVKLWSKTGFSTGNGR